MLSEWRIDLSKINALDFFGQTYPPPSGLPYPDVT